MALLPIDEPLPRAYLERVGALRKADDVVETNPAAAQFFSPTRPAGEWSPRPQARPRFAREERGGRLPPARMGMRNAASGDMDRDSPPRSNDAWAGSLQPDAQGTRQPEAPAPGP